jgi:hypothetical protein
MVSENATFGEPEAAPGKVEVEESFFRRGEEGDREARAQLRRRLTAMPRWPGLGWAIALVSASLVAAVLLLVLPG